MKLSENSFYALAERSTLQPGKIFEGQILISGKKFSATFKTTSLVSGLHHCPYVSVKGRLPLEVRWGDRLSAQVLPYTEPGYDFLIIYPEAEKLKKLKEEKLIPLLDRFSTSVETMLLALADGAGIRGLREEAILAFGRLKPSELRKSALNLEKEGRVHILEFSPLSLLSQSSFDYLTRKILGYLQSYHQRRPQEAGVPVKKIKDRFSLPNRILLLALRRLARDLQVVLDGELASAGNFQVKFSAEEDKVMKAIERLFLEKKFSSASFEELVKKFKIHPSRLNTMLGLLLQKQKIVQSKDGFILHSQWLEELKSQVAQMKRKGKTELTVGEFKKMTGLTRKYAIPLLEFLDELGLTRRMGSKRAIL
jgi:selenocysteine-specific elongation factor